MSISKGIKKYLVCVVIFSILFFFGFYLNKTTAQQGPDFYVSSDKYSINLNDSTKMTAVINSSWVNNDQGIVKATFPNVSGGTFSPTTCVFPNSSTSKSSCSVNFKGTKAGTFEIKAYTITLDNKRYWAPAFNMVILDQNNNGSGGIEVQKVVSPSDQSVSEIGPFPFSVTYKVLPPKSTPARDVVMFEAWIDGTPHTVDLVPVKAPTGSIISEDKTPQRIGKVFTTSFRDNNPAPFTSGGVYTWKIYDYYTNQIYKQGQFKIKQQIGTGSGYYFIAKLQSTTVNEYYYSVSSRYATEDECNTGWTSYVNQNPKALPSTTPTCKQYDTLPTTPENENVPTQGTTETNYTLLAPLPGLTNFDTSQSCELARYLNIAIKIILGICAVLAVIMMIYGGFQYMTSVIISEKKSARDSITNALFGLILALGAYLILYTINPNILNICIDQQIPVVDATIDPDLETSASTDIANLSSPTATCIEGYVNISTQSSPSSINVCKSIANNLSNLLSAAKNSGIILSGYGSRTKAQQVALRVAHGCPDNSTPSNSCHPPTARPGHSKHESGKAVDFNCNGKSLSKNDQCYAWLVQHASSSYGMYNFANEPWHWSDDGH